MIARRGTAAYALDVMQRSLDVDPQPSLFDQDDRDLLADIAAQVTDADRDAATRLSVWARQS